VRLEAWDPADGGLNERRLMRSIEHEGFEVAVYTYSARTEFPWHQHENAKCDAVLEGILRIEVEGGEVFNLQAGDRLYLPAQTRHRAQVIGRRTVVFLDGTMWS
jgi:quercetin dioxygenase-like cupin family protein